MVGAYATALLAPHGGWAAAMLGAAALGAGLREVLGLGLLSIRLDGDYLAIVTLGFGEVMRLLLLRARGRECTKAQVRCCAAPATARVNDRVQCTPLPAHCHWLTVCTTAAAAHSLKRGGATAPAHSLEEALA